MQLSAWISSMTRVNQRIPLRLFLGLQMVFIGWFYVPQRVKDLSLPGVTVYGWSEVFMFCGVVLALTALSDMVFLHKKARGRRCGLLVLWLIRLRFASYFMAFTAWLGLGYWVLASREFQPFDLQIVMFLVFLGFLECEEAYRKREVIRGNEESAIFAALYR